MNRPHQERESLAGEHDQGGQIEAGVRTSRHTDMEIDCEKYDKQFGKKKSLKIVI